MVYSHKHDLGRYIPCFNNFASVVSSVLSLRVVPSKHFHLGSAHTIVL